MTADARAPRRHHPVGVAAAVAGLAAALLGVGLVVAPREDADLPATLAVLALVALAAAVAVVPGVRPRAATVLAVTGLLAAIGTAVAAVASGWPGAGPVLLVVGALLVLLVPAVGGHGAPSAVGGGLVALGVVAAVLVAPPLGVLDGLLARLPTTTTDAPGPAGPVPTAAGVRWTWGSGELADAVIAGPGLVVAPTDGSGATDEATEVVGLDTVTGVPRWSHRRAGTTVDRLVATPDGRDVAVLTDHSAGGRPSTARVLSVLDAGTGRPRWSVPSGRSLHVTDRVVAGIDPAGRFEGRDRGTGAVLWSVPPPPACAFAETFLGGTVEVLPVVRVCPGPLGGPLRTRSLVGIDEQTGGLRWTTPERPLGDGRDGRLATVAVTTGGRYLGWDDEAGDRTAVLDVRTGGRVAQAPPGTVLSEAPGGVPVVVDADVDVSVPLARRGAVDPAGGALVAAPPCAARAPATVAVLGGRTLALCGVGGGRFELRDAAGRVRTVDLPAAGDREPGYVLVLTPGGPVALPGVLAAGPVVGLEAPD